MFKSVDADFCKIGLEADICRDGKILLDEYERKRMDFFIGAVHHIPECKVENPNDENVANELLRLSECLLRGGTKILAHPLRAVTWSKCKVSGNLSVRLAALLKKYNAIAELNFHNNLPPESFVLACLENNVKFCFGSDAHNLYEVGEFYGQLAMLERIASGLDVDEVLAPL